MKNSNKQNIPIRSIKELHSYLGLSGPDNPLISVIDHSSQAKAQNPPQPLVLDCYNITIKRSFRGKLKYGRKSYDFDHGSMSFVAPHQVISVDPAEQRNQDGWSLLFHPDLIRAHQLGGTIRGYNFFSYGVDEALHLSEQEQQTIETIVANIKREISSRLDNFSQQVLISNLELLLSYCNRFYGRQFITRKMASNDLLVSFEQILDQHFSKQSAGGLPTVEKLARELNVSPSYLSDMLRSLTGQNTQQHIHVKMIEIAKQILSTTKLSIAEIAYRLGFDYPQSFSKLFRNKTSLTPKQFRASYSQNHQSFQDFTAN